MEKFAPKTSSVPVRFRHPTISQQIGAMEGAPRYEIVDTIASGDFAVVYRARDRELGREVAIKQIHQQFLGDQRQLARYWQEAQLLASLQHPSILTIYDIVRPGMADRGVDARSLQLTRRAKASTGLPAVASGVLPTR